MQVLRKIQNDGFLIIEYTTDGQSVSHRVKRIITESSREPVKGHLTLEERVEQLQSDNTTLLMAMTDVYSEIQSLKGGNK